MNLATSTEASIGTRTLNSIHLGTTRLWLRPTWPTIAELPLSSPTIYSKALTPSGATAVVSDLLGVRVYDISGGVFEQRGGTITNAQNVAISTSGNLIATSDTSGAGSVKIYEWNGNEWLQKGQTVGPTTGSRTGQNLLISPDAQKIIFGETSSNGSGLIRTIEWNGTSWSNASQYNSPTGDYFGIGGSLSLSADGLTLVAASPGSNTPWPGTTADFYDSGRVRIFEWQSGEWTPTADLDGTWHEQRFGNGGAVISGDKIIVGTPYFRALPSEGVNIGPVIGKVSIFQKSGASWVEHSSFTGTETSIVGGFVDIRGGRIFARANAGLPIVRTKSVIRIYDLVDGEWVEASESNISPSGPSVTTADGQTFLATSNRKIITEVTGNPSRPFTESSSVFLILKTETAP